MISTIKSHNSNKRMQYNPIRAYRINRDIILYTFVIYYFTITQPHYYNARAH